MRQVTNYQCPACTGPLHFEESTGKLKDGLCGMLPFAQGVPFAADLDRFIAALSMHMIFGNITMNGYTIAAAVMIMLLLCKTTDKVCTHAVITMRMGFIYIFTDLDRFPASIGVLMTAFRT